jgi:hypothetical protein
MRIFAALAVPCFLGAAILPDAIGAYHRTGSSKPALADRPIWDEYALKDTEIGVYENAPAKPLTVTVWQLADTTGSLAAFDWQRPPGAQPSAAAPMAVETAGALLAVDGNCLLRFEGYKPAAPELAALFQSLKNLDTTPLPALPSYLPSAGLVPLSERYVTGPASLAKFDAAIPPSVAAFHFGAEAQVAVFHSPKGDLTLAIFNYPTPQIAMQKVEDFTKLPGALAKRSGPLVAVTLSPPDPDQAERLLSSIRYQAEITRDQYVPTRRDNMGDLLLNICILIGLLVAFALVTGFFYGGARALARQFRKGPEPEAVISLHLK